MKFNIICLFQLSSIVPVSVLSLPDCFLLLLKGSNWAESYCRQYCSFPTLFLITVIYSRFRIKPTSTTYNLIISNRYTAPIRDLFPRLLQKVGVLRHFYSLANISNKIWVKETKNRFKSLHLRALTCFFIYPPKKKSMATQNSAAPIRKLKGNSVIQTQHFQILQQIFEFKLIYI